MALVPFPRSPAYRAASRRSELVASMQHRPPTWWNPDLLDSPRSPNPGKIDIRIANGNLTHQVRLDQLVREATTEKPNGAR